MEKRKWTKREVVEKLLNDPATKNDWIKSTKMVEGSDFAEYCDTVYENSSENEIIEFMRG